MKLKDKEELWKKRCNPFNGFLTKSDSNFVVTYNAETLRMIAYVNFWIMVGSAILATKLFVHVDLSDTPLIKTFGYNNICVYWDYEPARTMIAMIYPFVEIPLVFYLFNKSIKWKMLHSAGYLPTPLYILTLINTIIEVLLGLMFRMIFVVEAFQNVVGHTLPFQGLQVCLCLVAVENFLYDYKTNNVPFKNHQTFSRPALIIGFVYLISLLIVTSLKIIYVTSVFLKAPVFDVTVPAQKSFVTNLDTFWMFLAAVVPFFLALRGRIASGDTDIKIQFPIDSERVKRKKEGSKNEE